MIIMPRHRSNELQNCAEFGISSGTDFRFEEGDNHGLGSVFIYVLITNSEIRVEKPSKAI